MNSQDFVSFGSVARSQMGQQCQYASRYFNPDPLPDYPYLGEGLRIVGDFNLYHSLQIHKDDVAEAVKRYLTYITRSI